MTCLVQDHAEQVDRGADLPGFVTIEVHVAGDGFRVRRRIKSVGEYGAGSVEWVGVAMGAAGEEDINGSRIGGALSGREGQIAALGPLVESAHDLGLSDEAIAANQTITTVTAAPAREAGEKIEDDGTAFEKVVEFLDGLKVI